MRHALLLPIALFACGAAQTTPAGPLGRIDLASKLPEGVAKGAEDPTAEHQRSAEVCASEGLPGVPVKVRWETFSKGENRYISSYAVELTRPGEGVVVKLAEPGPVKSRADSESKEPYIATVNVVVTCKREGTETKSSIELRADGKSAK